MTREFIDPRLKAQVLAIGPLPSISLRPAFPPSLPALAEGVQVVTTGADAERMADALGRLDVAFVGLDTEFRYGDPGDPNDDDWQDLTRLRPLQVSLVAMVPGEGGVGYVPVRYSVDVRRPDTHAGLARALTAPHTFVAHHFKSEYLALRALGLPWPRAWFCTWIAAQMLDLGRHHARYIDPAPTDDAAEETAERAAGERRKSATSLLTQLSRYGIAYPFGGDKSAMQRRFASLSDEEPLTAADHEYATADAYGAAALYLPQRLALAEAGLAHHYDTIELPAALTLAEIERAGVTVDRAKIRVAREAAERAVTAYERELRAYGFREEVTATGGTRVMVGSVVERRRVFDELRLLHMFVSGRTASGYSFGKERLKEHQAVHRAIRLLYLHAKYSGILRDRLFAEEFIGTDGRVHPWINPLGADSGRPSFKKPNLVGLGKILRPIVVPDDPGYEIAELDYVAQEVFIAAAHFGDPVLLDDCNRGDPYCEMIRQFCRDDFRGGDVPTDDGGVRAVLGSKRFAERRGQMKILMLATMYGMGDKAIATQAGVTLEGAHRLRTRFFERYNGLAMGMERAVHQLQERGYTQTVTGLRRYRGQTGPLSSWEGRWAVNACIQGGATCVLKAGLPPIQAFLGQHGGRILLPIFDANLIQYPRGTGPIVLPGVRDLMIDAMKRLFPGTRPRVDVNALAPWCWNKNGRSDSIERFVEDPEFKP